MGSNTACDHHTWDMTEESFIQMAAGWHDNGDAPADHYYVSTYAVHYWHVLKCKDCGAEKLLSAVLDRKDAEPVSDTEFMWLSLFITQLNKETGYLEQKKALINDSLDQMHWAHFPYVAMHNPDENYFSIAYKQNQFLQYDWDFYDALHMFKAMNERARAYLEPEATDELNEKLGRLGELKKQYQTLMELSTQSGLDSELQQELDRLAAEFQKLSDELKDLV